MEVYVILVTRSYHFGSAKTQIQGIYKDINIAENILKKLGFVRKFDDFFINIRDDLITARLEIYEVEG